MRALLAGLSALALVLTASPALAVIPTDAPLLASAATPPSEPAVDVLYEREFSVREGDDLIVDLGAENVVVETGRGTRASVRVEGTGRGARDEFERRRFAADYGGGRLHVRTQPQRTGRTWGRSSASFTVTIRVPERFDVTVDLGAGNVSLASLRGDVTVDTGSGNVSLDGARGGRIALGTGSGNVRTGRLAGSSVSANTGSGNVQIESVDGPLTVDTGSGNVSVALARVAEAAITTGSGRVTVSLPDGADADLVADGGRVRIDDRLAFDGRLERDGARGRLGRGGPRLAVETGSGGIEISVR